MNSNALQGPEVISEKKPVEHLSPSEMDDQQRSVLELATENDFAQAKIGGLLETIDTLEFYVLDSQLSALSRQALADGHHGAHRA